MSIAMPRFLTQRPMQHWALLVAVGVLILVVTDVVSRLWPGQSAVATQMPPVLRRGPVRTFDIERIIQSHVFGHAETPVAKVAVAPDTRLRLKLVGVVANTDSAQARAMIAADGGKARSFAIGRPITGTDATLHGIEETRVLIRRGGAIEQLKLERKPRESPAPGVAAGAAPSVRPVPEQPEPDSSPFGSGVASPVKAAGGEQSANVATGDEEEANDEDEEPEQESTQAEAPTPPPRAPARK